MARIKGGMNAKKERDSSDSYGSLVSMQLHVLTVYLTAYLCTA